MLSSVWGQTTALDEDLCNSWRMRADAVDSGEWRANKDNENRGRYGGWEGGGKREGSSEEWDGDSWSTVEAIKTHTKEMRAR